jgi:preprotein translocase subunit SecY
MGILEKFDPIIKLLPGIKKPGTQLSLKEKLKWSAIIMAVYFVLFSIPAYGVNQAVLNAPGIEQLISIVFAARIGTLITVGISPIVVAGIVFSFLSGADLLKIDQNDPVQRSRMQGLQKLTAIIIAVIEAVIFTATGQVSLMAPGYFLIVVVQLFIGALFIIYLDEAMSKWGITSGINLFIAGNVSYSIIAGTLNILLPEAIFALSPASGAGAAAIPQAIQSFGPLFFAIVVLLISIYAYDITIEIPLVFNQFRGVGGRFPIPLLYVSVLPVVLATALQLNLVLLLTFVAHYAGFGAVFVHFIATYSPSSTGSEQLTGGLLYLTYPSFPLPYLSQYGGIGGYGNYFSYFFTTSNPLTLPWGGVVLVPEWVHAIIYTITLVILCIIFGKFWTEMAGQSSKSLAGQLQDYGWQIPGFRRDPRTIETVLDRYVPSIITIGSIFVALLAAFAQLTDAIGSGMGILLTVGIIYMVYKQLEQENAIQGYPQLEKLLS